MEKVCYTCKKSKVLEEFHKRPNGKPQSNCIPCHKNYINQHYQDNKEYYLKKSKNSSKKTRDKCNEYIKTLSCLDCGYSFKEYPSVCDFHNFENNKTKNVSNLKETSFSRFMDEANKCIPLCANCHRIRHSKINKK